MLWQAAGMRTIAWIAVTVDGGHATAEAHGITNRLPGVRRIPMATASELAARGVPVVVRRTSGRADRAESSSATAGA